MAKNVKNETTVEEVQDSVWLKVNKALVGKTFEREYEGDKKEFVPVHLNLGTDGTEKWGTLFVSAKKILPAKKFDKDGNVVGDDEKNVAFSIVKDKTYKVYFKNDKDENEAVDMTGINIFDAYVANQKAFREGWKKDEKKEKSEPKAEKKAPAKNKSKSKSKKKDVER